MFMLVRVSERLAVSVWPCDLDVQFIPLYSTVCVIALIRFVVFLPYMADVPRNCLLSSLSG